MRTMTAKHPARSQSDDLVSELVPLTPEERQRILVQWNDTASDYPRDRCIHALFEEQVSRTPQATALQFGERRFDYAEVNARANQLAHHLIDLGVGPEVLVGICMERSPELIVALLAILKAGGAYVPLDPSYPKARLSFMLEDARVPVLLTQQALLGCLPSHPARVLCLDGDWAQVAPQPDIDPPPRASAEALAYVIYTSGSTGEPKGVMIEHRALVNHMVWMQARFPLAGDDLLLQKTSISADASVWELFAALVGGARLVLAAPGVHRSPADLVETLRRDHITVVQVVPSMLDAMLQEQSLAQCTSLRRVYCGGETLDRRVVREFHEQSRAELINLYGPTEATIDATHRVCSRDSGARPVTIGRPIANTRIYILDEQREPVQTGSPGEIYVGGDGLARGYLHREQLTAERFVPDPFSRVPGARLYRTGDRARYQPDGEIEFLGRADLQLKIRGFRIEPGEIEAVLARAPTIRQTVVVSREDSPGDVRLVAYIVPSDGPAAGVEPLRTLARENLPEHMRPSAYVFMERLPLTPNGKLDRNALPIPQESRETERDSTAAATPLEIAVAGVWREVLKLDRVGIHEDFFELGGHSLLAARIASRLARLANVELPLGCFFEHPTIAGLAAEIENRADGDPATQAEEITAVERDGNPPLSFAQQRMWFLDRMWHDSCAYQIREAWRVYGPIDVSALQRSLDALIARHEVLRTSFQAQGDFPAQVTAPRARVSIAIKDATVLPLSERELELRRILEGEDSSPFDLATGPLLRARLLRLDAEEHILSFDTHHIVFDGWSASVFARELSVAYRAYVNGTRPELPELVLQYADYALWQRHRLKGDFLEEQLEYWKRNLQTLSTLDLPIDRPRPRVPTQRGAQFRAELPTSLVRALDGLGRRGGATLFMTLLAAFQTLLHRYTGQTDITVGSPVSGRDRIELEGLIGLFVNTLVLRADLSDDPAFREFMERVRDGVLSAYAHQDVPFEKIVEALAPERGPGRNPLFQVMFALQYAPEEDLELQGAQSMRLPVRTQTSKFDLSVAFDPAADGLTGIWEYSTDVFEEHTIERMATHFRRLLEEIVADPDQRVGALCLLDSAERQRVLMQWNDTASDFPKDRSVPVLFEEQVTRAPHAAAVQFGARRLSYSELNGRANQLAHHLTGLGVGSEVLVGICMERSPELIVALLAVLKAGGAYVPLDPAYPKQRLSFMLDDAGAPVLLTQHDLLESLPSHSARVVCLDRDWPQIATHPDVDPPPRASVEALAYVTYTSGSTGEPKGVMITHRSISKLVRDQSYVRLSAADTVAQVSSVSFDAATFEIWGALLNGGRLAIIAREEQLDPERLATALDHLNVTCLFLTTALFNRIALTAPGAFQRVRHLLFGGETCDPEPVRAVLAAGFPGRLLHVYGPTETTTFATFHQVRQVLPGERRIPIGRPIANTRAYILDARLDPVPIGVAGSLYIGGDGVARGYWRRRELNRERFLPDPHATAPGARMYSTGDIARFLPDGNIEFLGRTDRQIKLRGYRIELGEIEAVLSADPAARQVAVVVREEAGGDKRLVAYVVPSDASCPLQERLRSNARRYLPEYMVPSAFVVLDELPLTPNGKVDVRALAARTVNLPARPRPDAMPRDDVERTLCRIWEETLGGGPVGLDDDFFDRGGHSLLAATLFARQDGALGRSPSIATLFKAPTVRSLARVYREGSGPAASSALVPISPGGFLPPIFAVPGVNGNVMCFADLARELGASQPFFGLQSAGLDGACEPLETIEEMAAHYLREVRRQQARGPYYLLGACFGATVALEMARQLLEHGDEVAFIGLLDPSPLHSETVPEASWHLPASWRSALALGRFLLDRIRAYRQEMIAMGAGERAHYLRRKMRLVVSAVRARDPLQSSRREFNQRRVYEANLEALLRYRAAPLRSPATALEVFSTERRLETGTHAPQVDWSTLTGIPAQSHRVPGMDSGDMLTGTNVKELASVISARLLHAPPASGIDAVATGQATTSETFRAAPPDSKGSRP
jgi:amino acid adenylation domain-containing protein